ncbi:hypothetical protein [Enterobacter roggenkampii]|uniref:hypothetical protein n=1 Tax=Enterobacter roggenkampii TaxID=1812935 RepID=UPI00103E87A3|nr:hypothetical protein [Enterobacter roggenkampii]MCK6947931.1 hypothetical protein [Enterobacter roggenkampii]HCR2173682.1 hypothetical protein [Enterobacter roggenkampii]
MQSGITGIVTTRLYAYPTRDNQSPGIGIMVRKVAEKAMRTKFLSAFFERTIDFEKVFIHQIFNEKLKKRFKSEVC